MLSPPSAATAELQTLAKDLLADGGARRFFGQRGNPPRTLFRRLAAGLPVDDRDLATDLGDQGGAQPEPGSQRATRASLLIARPNSAVGQPRSAGLVTAELITGSIWLLLCPARGGAAALADPAAAWRPLDRMASTRRHDHQPGRPDRPDARARATTPRRGGAGRRSTRCWTGSSRRSRSARPRQIGCAGAPPACVPHELRTPLATDPGLRRAVPRGRGLAKAPGWPNAMRRASSGEAGAGWASLVADMLLELARLDQGLVRSTPIRVARRPRWPRDSVSRTPGRWSQE